VPSELHRADGPAIACACGETYQFWQGVEVAEWVIRRPDDINASQILDADRAALRSLLIERMGAERGLTALRVRMVNADAYGVLWHYESARPFRRTCARRANWSPGPLTFNMTSWRSESSA
jgi:hypothetical protein